jgi:hypothetical protein
MKGMSFWAALHLAYKCRWLLYDFLMLSLFPRMLIYTKLSGEPAGLEVEWYDRSGSLPWSEGESNHFYLGHTQLLLGIHLKSVQNIGKILGFWISVSWFIPNRFNHTCILEVQMLALFSGVKIFVPVNWKTFSSLIFHLFAFVNFSTSFMFVM